MASGLVKGVFDITCYIVNAAVRIILRDLTNYYWYLDETDQQNDTAGEGLISNSYDEGNNSLGSIQDNERPDILNGQEHEFRNIPCESFCTSLNIEDYTSDDLNEIQRIDENTKVQNYDINQSTLESLQQELSNEIQETENRKVVDKYKDNLDICESSKKESYPNKLEALHGNEKNEDTSKVHSNECSVTNSEPPENESQSYIPDEIEDTDSLVWNDEENLNLLKTFKKQNPIWMEIENSSLNFEAKNVSQEDPKTNSKKLPENLYGNLEEVWENTSTNKTEKETTDVEKSLEETKANNLVADVYAVEDGHNAINISIKSSIPTKKNYETSENKFIGDRKISDVRFQNDDTSNKSSECEFGIRNFLTQNLKIKCSVVKELNDINKKKEGSNKKSDRRKYQKNKRCVPPPKQKEQLKTADETINMKPNNITNEIENIRLLPLTSYEITGTSPLLNDSQEITVSEAIDAVDKFNDFTDDLSEISAIPEDISDIGSILSGDSIFSKFESILRKQCPANKPEVTLPQPSVAATEESKESLCDCVNSHPCLYVDSDDDLSAELLSVEQLDSVETGSSSQKHA